MYNAILWVLHRGTLAWRYRMMASEIGGNMHVFDVGCGTGELAGFLDKTCRYSGIDLNERFVEHAKKKGLDVISGDVFDGSNYPDGIDVIVLSDILHHVVPEHDKLVRLCKSKADKLIICEPYSKQESKKTAHKIMYWIRNIRLFHDLLGDGDGINDFENMKQWHAHGKRDIIRLFRRYGMKDIYTIGNNVVGVWNKSASGRITNNKKDNKNKKQKSNKSVLL